MADTDCTSTLCVNFNVAAVSHAQVMGVMAGFVVAAIAVVLERPRAPTGDGQQAVHDGIQALFVALVAFIVAAFLYGIAGGVEASPQRAAAMILAAALPAAAGTNRSGSTTTRSWPRTSPLTSPTV
ncbi:hypothetical protein ACFWUU_05540 [Kribbella sp. NPDC058693]|uniref:hypothetical protein n=1 Tax=Kribbella sp. NPDC058693 TaxID=3346602 RepID=UPI00365E4428